MISVLVYQNFKSIEIFFSFKIQLENVPVKFNDLGTIGQTPSWIPVYIQRLQNINKIYTKQNTVIVRNLPVYSIISWSYIILQPFSFQNPTMGLQQSKQSADVA